MYSDPAVSRFVFLHLGESIDVVLDGSHNLIEGAFNCAVGPCFNPVRSFLFLRHDCAPESKPLSALSSA